MKKQHTGGALCPCDSCETAREEFYQKFESDLLVIEGGEWVDREESHMCDGSFCDGCAWQERDDNGISRCGHMQAPCPRIPEGG